MVGPSVPVLMYHHVLPKGDFISVAVERFRAQIAYLARRGWHSLSAEEFLAFKLGRRLPPRSLLITFDDGWLDNYLYAFPVLQEFRMRAVVFLVTGWVAARSRNAPLDAIGWRSHQEAMALARGNDSPSVLHLEQIARMQESGLIEFHSHTHTHRPRQRAAYDLGAELEASQAFFQAHLGYRSQHLCFPWGQHLEGDAAIAREHGFAACYTTANGPNLPDGNSGAIHRFSVKDRPLPWLAMKLALFRRPALARRYGAYKARRAGP
jgi:peptidoglycan/xylan/chitin deacetylase (PgdA/CDA1 family)